MSDTLENKAVEILDKSQEAIASFADKLVDLGKQYGPDVADAALQMARVDAISALVTPGIWLVFLTVAFVFLLKAVFPWAQKHADDSEGCSYAVFGVPAALVLAGLIGSVINFANIWAWVGIFEPKLWLAKRVLGL